MGTIPNKCGFVGVGEALGRALRRAGCLGLDARLRRAHPELSEYVHAPSACAVLRALLAAAGGEARGVRAQVELLEHARGAAACAAGPGGTS